jgi:uncharacterized repeat protein (TIGR01451 family)
MRFYTTLIPFIFVFLALQRLSAQVPFDCTGQFYITFTPLISPYSTLVETVIDPVTDQVEFITISDNLGTLINGAGYRSTDNFIHAVHPLDHNLYQIDALGIARDLGVVDLNRGHLYFAADISPDGRYLVLIGTPGFVNGADEEIRLVDLSVAGYPVTTRPLTGMAVNVLDIAFDPTDNKLYGVDARGNRLVLIDFTDGTITAPFPATPLMDDAGSLFFDTFGDLFAYGGPPGNNGIQNTLYKVDKLTGEFRILTTGTRADATDGCSCPHTVELRKVVHPRVMVPCGEVEYVFTIANSSAIAQDGIDLQDTLPAGFTITEIVYNPYGGTVKSGDGSRVLHVENLSLLPGIDSIIVRVAIDDLPDGVYKNQALLNGLPQALGSFALSDDPTTIIKRDSTALVLQSYDDDLTLSLSICPGDEVQLNAQEYGKTFIWNDGTTGSMNTIFNEGQYQVMAITACDTLLVSYDVQATDIRVSFDPEEYEIRLGDSVLLVPLVVNEGSTTLYHWTAPEGSGLISCKECPQITVTPFFNTEYTVVAENDAGCMHSATVLVKVDRTLRYFAPNIFSPNGDNINDEFYFRIRGVATIRRFVLYDRWGDVLHTSTTSMMRDPEVQWSLRNVSDSYLPGVYVWLAEVGYIDGSHEFISGDVTLIR